MAIRWAHRNLKSIQEPMIKLATAAVTRLMTGEPPRGEEVLVNPQPVEAAGPSLDTKALHLCSRPPSSVTKKVQIRQGEGTQGVAVAVPDTSVVPVVRRKTPIQDNIPKPVVDQEMPQMEESGEFNSSWSPLLLCDEEEGENETE